MIKYKPPSPHFCQAVNELLSLPEFNVLHKYKLDDHEWTALQLFVEILSVRHSTFLPTLV